MKAFIAIVIIYCCNYNNGEPVKESLIVGAQPVKDIRQYPYIVVVWTSMNGKDYFTQCTGTILNPKYVLTAGRCLLSKPQIIKVSVGSTKVLNGVKYYSHKYAIHPQYDYETQEFNCGLVIMDPVIQLNGTIKPVVLAQEGTKVQPESLINLAGWSTRNEVNNPSDNTDLNEIEVPIVSQAECAKSYKDVSNIKITDNVFCAKSGGQDACRGDWGDPAMLNGVQVGISSGGVWCGRPSYPGTYTLVASIRPWLKQVAGI